jgi:hypothetical protein
MGWTPYPIMNWDHLYLERERQYLLISGYPVGVEKELNEIIEREKMIKYAELEGMQEEDLIKV